MVYNEQKEKMEIDKIMSNNVLDLFCGAGGLSKGFYDAGYDVLLGVDFDDAALKTFKENHGSAEAMKLDLFNHDNIEKINELIEISEKTIKNIKQNLFWAFFYNICMIPIACGILENIGIEMNPMVAAFAMTISSLTVVLNALRLKK